AHRLLQQRQRSLRLSRVAVNKGKIVHGFEGKRAGFDGALVELRGPGTFAELVVQPAEIVEIAGVVRLEFHGEFHESLDEFRIFLLAQQCKTGQSRWWLATLWINIARAIHISLGIGEPAQTLVCGTD